MSSAKTYELRDIVSLMNEAIESYKKSAEAITKTIETSKTFQDFMEGFKIVNAHHTRGTFRLSVAYEKLAKGAKLEEEKANREGGEKVHG